MKIHAMALVLLIALVACCGCIGSPAVFDRSEGSLHAHYESSDDWSVGLGCYERVNGYVYNAGNESSGAVRLNFNLVNMQTGTIRDSRSVFIGTINPGATTTYETVLDGECTRNYRVDFSFGN